MKPQAGLFAAADVEQMVYQIVSAVEAGERAAKTGAERFAEAGGLLLQVKSRLKHGEWESWVEKHVKRPVRVVRRWMLLAKRSPATDLEEAWAVINGHRDDELDDIPTDRPESSSRASAAGRSGDMGEVAAATSPAAGIEADGAASGQPPPLSDLAKRLERLGKALEWAVRAAKTRDGPRAVRDRTVASVGVLRETMPLLLLAPVRKPFAGKCRSCGEDGTWAVTEGSKWILLQEGRGYEIISGVAVAVERGAGTYRAHFLSCSKGGREGF